MRGPEAYDLGDVAPARPPELRRPAMTQPRSVPRWGWPVGAGAAHSLSLFVPGAGQFLRGQQTAGLFFFCSIAFLGSLTWAILDTLDRLAATFGLLGLPLTLVFWILALAYLLAAGLHLASVSGAAGPDAEATKLHPVATGIASALVPGWGQLLNGNRIRGIAFLGGLWIVCGVHISTSTAATEIMNSYVPVVAPWEQFARGPMVLWAAKWTLPVVVWSLAIYDATATAIIRRQA